MVSTDQLKSEAIKTEHLFKTLESNKNALHIHAHKVKYSNLPYNAQTKYCFAAG